MRGSVSLTVRSAVDGRGPRSTLRPMSGTTLRERLTTGHSVVMPGVWDALSARLAAGAGFHTVFLSGYCVSGTLLGLPDFGYLTQTEMAEVARRVCAANPGLDVVVDADTGYGNPLNTIRTVELWRQAGASGVFLEDQVWPKKCGHMAGKQVVERRDWLAKLRAAVDHADGLHVTARTDARAAVHLAEAIERAKMARDTGVDALFVEAPESLAELEQIASALPDITLVANMVETGRTPLLTPQELAELGFRLIVSPLSGLFSMVKALQTSFEVLQRDGSMRGHLDQLVEFAEFGALVDLDGHYATETRYPTDRPVEE
jgi:methylisocitrate lyase